MLQRIESSAKNVLAIEVIDGFTETDEKICKNIFRKN